MNILADENVDGSIVAFLRLEHHEVLWMVEHAPGTSDADILAIAARNQQIILTFDRDFGELVFHHGRPSCGIILLRLHPATPDLTLEQFRTIWPRLLLAVPNHFVVATATKIRVRPLPLVS
jgi:predicted nuclease of predicted toxin-antitoxin system